MTKDFEWHQPVMTTEVIMALAPAAGHVAVDATVGDGGHTEALLDGPHAPKRVVGVDRDPTAVARARQRLSRFGERARVVHGTFDELSQMLSAGERADLAAVLADLGVSSRQLDDARRGFSYRNSGPLDMRMDTTSGGPSAYELVNDLDAEALARLLRDYGDERFADRIAHAIVGARPIGTTGELATVVRDAIPAAARRSGRHPARRAFQAIRIAVNSELERLGPAVAAAAALVQPGGVIAVLTYHSGEDRIVAGVMRDLSKRGAMPPGWPVEPPAARYTSARPQRPTVTEIDMNPRAEPARLRVLTRAA